ncbi:MAG TPA: HlyD family efflux transporter periplasmic adaptor subunit, partial [Phycisphaerae bacterium]|nr:HlyD family efflux transporter periplasmic adaptor subunit [Phycisphaerae bacterium]
RARFRLDLTIPISGTGEIQPKSRTEIKPEASGEVTEIPVESGDIVAADTLLIKLDPEDEDRSVTRTQNELDRAEATLTKARLALKQAQTTSLAQIDARIKSAEAQLTDAEFRLTKVKGFKAQDTGFTRPDELVQAQAAYDQLAAQLDGLRADRGQAEIAIDLAQQDVKLAEKAVETAETNLGDAQKRLRETEIRSPVAGMVTNIAVEVGAVVQGGKTTITGGTVLARVADISDIYVRTEVSDADIGAVMWLAPAKARPGGEQLAARIQKAEAEMLISTSGLLTRDSTVGVPVKITVDAFPDQKFEGFIERIYPEPVKMQNIVTYLVDILVTSPNSDLLKLTMGMQADVEFTAQSVHDVLLVPHDAIRRGPGGDLGVYAPEKAEDGTVRPRFIKCRFGLDNGLYAELIDGEGINDRSEVYTKLPTRFEHGEDEDQD